MSSRVLTPARSRRLGYALGFVLAVAMLLTARIDAQGGHAPAASLAVETRVPGELVARGDLVVEAGELRPGRGQARETFTIRNATAAPLAVGASVGGDRDRLDEVVALRVVAGGRTIAEGRVGELRGEPRERIRLEQGESTRVTVSVSVPAGVADGYENRVGRRVLELAATTVER